MPQWVAAIPLPSARVWALEVLFPWLTRRNA
jgi:hypothetical protein